MKWLAESEMLDWPQAEAAVGWTGNTADEALAALGCVRERTLTYLTASTEESLQTPIPMPEAWHQYFGPTVEPEELVRWIARHEYYHLGQIITYRWMRGDNPYRR